MDVRNRRGTKCKAARTDEEAGRGKTLRHIPARAPAAGAAIGCWGANGHRSRPGQAPTLQPGCLAGATDRKHTLTEAARKQARDETSLKGKVTN